MSTFTVNVLTLFPELYPGNLGVSVLGRAMSTKIWHLNVINIRDFAKDTYKHVDDTPYGGGAGMVMRADILGDAIDSISHKNLVYPSPRGVPFSQKIAEKWTKDTGITLIAGRYEGIDQRILDYYDVSEVSLGDFVLAGGDVAVQAMLEASLRLLPGVLGNQDSLKHESFQNDLLEYPQYTRPEVWREISVPKVLQSGHHHNINAWRLEESQKLTRKRRPDLISLSE